MRTLPVERNEFRLLIIDASAESQDAQTILREKNLFFSTRANEGCRYKPPCLITDDGRFEGLECIKNYTKVVDSIIKRRGGKKNDRTKQQ